MGGSIIRIVTSKRRFRTILKAFFTSPLNDSMIVAFVIGIFLLSIAGTMHPVASSKLTQENHYYVTPNETGQPAFTVFSDKVTYVMFHLPQGQKVNYSLQSLVEIHVATTLANPGGLKLVWQNLVSGTAVDGTIVKINPSNVSFAMQSQLSVNSMTEDSYNMTVVSYAFYNSTQSFNPSYAISGLSMALVSITVLASVAGMKVDET